MRETPLHLPYLPMESILLAGHLNIIDHGAYLVVAAKSQMPLLDLLVINHQNPT